MNIPIVYLDNCCFNRPFDDQDQLKVRLESEAKLHIQAKVKNGQLLLVWSFVLDYEIKNNPAIDRREPIEKWETLATHAVPPLPEIEIAALRFQSMGIKPMDALHLACAVHAQCVYFFTTDKGILKKRDLVPELSILNPVEYVESVEESDD